MPGKSYAGKGIRGEINTISVCFIENNTLTLQIKGYIMARPIKETPILFGSDARRFEERMQNPPKVSAQKRSEIRKSYETVIRMMDTRP